MVLVAQLFYPAVEDLGPGLIIFHQVAFHLRLDLAHQRARKMAMRNRPTLWALQEKLLDPTIRERHVHFAQKVLQLVARSTAHALHPIGL